MPGQVSSLGGDRVCESVRCVPWGMLTPHQLPCKVVLSADTMWWGDCPPADSWGVVLAAVLPGRIYSLWSTRGSPCSGPVGDVPSLLTLRVLLMGCGSAEFMFSLCHVLS